MLIDEALSRALAAFISREPHGYPHLDPAALEAECGAASDGLRPQVDALVAEMMALPFQGSDLAGGTRVAESIMAGRHPELGPDAIAALGFYYSYSWR